MPEINHTRTPTNCFHAHLEPISNFHKRPPDNGAFKPKFICTKCGAILFTYEPSSGDVQTIDEKEEEKP